MSRHLQLRKFLVVGALMGAAFGASAATPAASGATLPSASIYHLSTPLTDQDAKQFKLEDRRGRPMLVSMFYTSCQFVCPMLVDALRETQAKLTPAERERLSILMVSFDPEHDTVSVLKTTAEQRRLEPVHWTLARTDAGNARKLAAVLGIQYRALANGEFNHTTSLILIDSAGRIVGRTARLGDSDPNFVKQVKATVQSDPQ
jgi:protein SCO1/2